MVSVEAEVFALVRRDHRIAQELHQHEIANLQKIALVLLVERSLLVDVREKDARPTIDLRLVR